MSVLLGLLMSGGELTGKVAHGRASTWTRDESLNHELGGGAVRVERGRGSEMPSS